MDYQDEVDRRDSLDGQCAPTPGEGEPSVVDCPACADTWHRWDHLRTHPCGCAGAGLVEVCDD